VRPAFLAAVLGLLAMSTTDLHAENEPATTSSASDAQTQCVMMRTVNGWSRIDDQTLLLRSAGRRYKLHFDSPCKEANWAISARVDHEGVCLRPGDMMIFEIDSTPIDPRWHRGEHRGFEERCLIRSIERVPTP